MIDEDFVRQLVLLGILYWKLDFRFRVLFKNKIIWWVEYCQSRGSWKWNSFVIKFLSASQKTKVLAIGRVELYVEESYEYQTCRPMFHLCAYFSEGAYHPLSLLFPFFPQPCMTQSAHQTPRSTCGRDLLHKDVKLAVFLEPQTPLL